MPQLCKQFVIVAIGFALIAGSYSAFGQTSQIPANYLNPANQSGPQSTVTVTTDTETVNNSNGALTVSIPLLHLPGVNGLDLDLSVLYSSKNVDFQSYASGPVNSGNPEMTAVYYGANWGSSGVQQAPFQFGGGRSARLSIPMLVFMNTYVGTYVENPDADPVLNQDVYCDTNFIYVDENGGEHTFYNTTNCSNGNTYAEGLGVVNLSFSSDNSWIQLDTTNLNDIRVNLPNGRTVHFPTGLAANLAYVGNGYGWATPASIVDANGNAITFTWGTGNNSNVLKSITDTVGRTVMVTPTSISYYDSSGTQRTITVSETAVADNNDLSLQATQCAVDNLPTWQSVYLPTTISQDFGSGHAVNVITIPTGSGSRTYTVVTDSIGEPTEIEYPTGGYTKYDYTVLSNAYDSGGVHCGIQVRQVSDKRVCTSSTSAASGSCSSGENVTTYTAIADAQSNGQMTVLEPQNTGALQRKTVYTYSPAEANGTLSLPPEEVDKKIYSHNASSGQDILLRDTATTYWSTCGPNGTSYTDVNGGVGTLPDTVTTTYYDISPTITTKTSYMYDELTIYNVGSGSYPQSGANQPGYGCVDNPNTVTVTDFNGSAIKTTSNQWDYSLVENHIFHLPHSTSIISPSGWTATETYGHNSYGNITSVTKSGSSVSSPLTTTLGRNALGQLTSVTDPLGNTATYQYGGNTFDSACPNVSGVSAAPTSMIDALGHTDTREYYSCTGLLAQDKDPNGQATGKVTNYTYDGFGAPLCTTYPDGGSTCNNYNSYVVPLTITTTKTANPDPSIVSSETYDGLGRPLVGNLPSGLYTANGYDAVGELCATENPTVTSPSSLGLSCIPSDNPTLAAPTDGVIYTSYDALGRETAVTEQDGSSQTWSYSGNSVSFTDESGNQWLRTSDALGRLTNVYEPNGVSPAPTMQTEYSYDAAGNLLSVLQCGGTCPSANQESRSFTYDGLSRLLTASNPETGLVTYSYLSSSGTPCAGDQMLPCSRTDARDIKTLFAYDKLNRIVAKSYSNDPNGTPSSCFQYDTPLSGSPDVNPVGHLTAEWTVANGACPASNSEIQIIPASAYNSTVIMSHDPLGREGDKSLSNQSGIGDQQCPYGSDCGSLYTFFYTYDAAGSVTEFTNGWTPAASTVASPAISWSATYDDGGRIAQLEANGPWGTSNSAYPTNLLSSISYDPFDHIIDEEIGLSASTGFAGLNVISSYDNRARIQSENATGEEATSPAAGSVGVIAVNGAEQEAIQGRTASVTIAGSEKSPVTWNPCGSGFNCTTTSYDAGTAWVSINGQSTSASWGQGDTASSVASKLAAAINADSSSLGATANQSGATVQITANATSWTSGSISFSAGISDFFAPDAEDPFPSPSFTATASASTFSGGVGRIYDTGQVTVTLTNTSSGDGYGSAIATTTPVSWGSGSTGATLASALVSAINTAASGYVTASLDDVGGSVNLVSNATGSSADDYGIEVNATDTTSVNNPSVATSELPATSFEFLASSPSGAAGVASSGSAPVYTYVVPPGGYARNSNLLAYSDSVMGDWAFQYDTLNRLIAAAAADNAPSSVAHTIGCFGYDPFGNRTLNTYVSGGNCAEANTPNVSYNGANRVTFVSQSAPVSYSAPNGFTYDSSGDVTVDGQNQYAYDAEGRLCAVYNSLHGYTGYIYNAQGLRVAMGSVNSLSCNLASNGFVPKKLYLLDQSGSQVTEFSGSGAWTHSNVWTGAYLDATYDSVGLHFHLSDPLGTRRVQTDVYGRIENKFQSLPYGDDFTSVSPVGAPPTADDATEHHFTGKERDTESGNDYFGARYYASSMGRFLSPDYNNFANDPDPVPFADLENPQSLNLYSYVLNNPLKNRDSDGHSCDPDYTTTNANGDMVVHAGQCHLDWWDLPGYAWVGLANLMMAQNGKQAATGAGQMAYAYTTAVPFALAGVEMTAGAGLTSLGLEAGGKELLKDGTKAAAKQIVEDLPEGAQKASAKRAINAATSSEKVSITKSADGTLTVSRTRPGFDGSQTFTKTIDSAGNSKTVQTAVDSSGKLVHYDPKN